MLLVGKKSLCFVRDRDETAEGDTGRLIAVRNRLRGRCGSPGNQGLPQRPRRVLPAEYAILYKVMGYLCVK